MKTIPLNIITKNTTLRELLDMAKGIPVPKKLPSAKTLRLEGKAVFEIRLGEAEMTVYANGLFLYSLGTRATVRSINSCGKAVVYRMNRYDREARLKNDICIYMDLPFYYRLALEGENELALNADIREERHTYSYDTITDSSDLEDPDGDFTEGSAGSIDNSKLKAKMRRGFHTLTERQKKVIKYYYEEELSLQQIAKELHCSKQSVDESRKTALKKLRKFIADKKPGQ
jgi:RNA polymerase sigma factor (sigma-70 family)